MARDRRRRDRIRPAVKVGVDAGSPVFVGVPREERVRIHLIDYDTGHVREEDEPRLEDIARCRAATTSVTWLDLDGIHDPEVVQRVAEVFELHPLWVEDILNPTSRPKVEALADRVFAVLRVLTPVGDQVANEQVALVLGPGWVLSFQELPGDVWDPVRERIRQGAGRLRSRGADLLAHALMDAVVDAYFAVFERIDARVDALEVDALEPVRRDVVARVAELRAEVDVLRAAVWPLRDAVGALMRSEEQLIEARTLPFFRDLSDHLANLVDHVDGLRERMRGALDVHLALQGQRLNEAMRVLTAVSVIFMPLTFVAGLYGMNFDEMPGLHWSLGFPIATAVMAAIGIGIYLVFRRRGWL